MDELLHVTVADMASYGKIAVWMAVISIILRLLGTAFGPFLQAYAPPLYRALALLGTGLLAAINDAGGAIKALTPDSKTAARIPGPPTSLALAAVLVLATGCGANLDWARIARAAAAAAGSALDAYAAKTSQSASGGESILPLVSLDAPSTSMEARSALRDVTDAVGAGDCRGSRQSLARAYARLEMLADPDTTRASQSLAEASAALGRVCP